MVLTVQLLKMGDGTLASRGKKKKALLFTIKNAHCFTSFPISFMHLRKITDPLSTGITNSPQ